jgi:ADP-ribose pyrophosphatase
MPQRARVHGASAQNTSCHVKSKTDYSPKGFRWLQLQRIEWVGPDGRSRFWESLERSTTVQDAHNVDGADAVAVVAKTTDDSMLVIKQFRPPLDAYCLELPAGLIDPGETPSQAACRELLEETGYVATVGSISPVLYADPGITNANMILATCTVDMNTPENRNAEPKLHEGEFIETMWAPYGAGLLEWLLRKKREEGLEVDARLMMYAIGMHQAYVDVDTRGSADGNDVMERNGPALDAQDGLSPGSSEDDGVVKRQMSSRTNVNLMRMNTRRAIGLREVCAWGVAAVSIIASVMR